MRAEICRVNQDSLTKVWDNANWRLNYNMKVDGGHIKSIMD